MALPIKRLYDDKRRKRQIFVQITSWRGVSVGAKHFYAKVYEGDNPIVSESGLVYNSDDDELQGREFGGMLETAFHSYDAALDWVVDIIKEHFPNNTHKLFDCSGLARMKDVEEALKR
jgi:hypothetical protein